MNCKGFIAIIGTIILVVGSAQAGLSGGSDTIKPSLIYGAFIDDYVEKCECQASLLDSGSLNIRKIAMRATVKGAYLKANRTKMIRHLIEVNAPLNPSRIEYHLNQHFAQAVHPDEVYTALLKGTTK